jgi:hypothetical protein
MLPVVSDDDEQNWGAINFRCCVRLCLCVGTQNATCSSC